MSPNNPSTNEQLVLMKAEEIGRAVARMADEIIEKNKNCETVALLGILRRGRPLADRLAKALYDAGGLRPPVGSLATTLYRDDLRSGKPNVVGSKGQTHFDFDVDGRTVILVDDVIFAGRTARAALDEVMDYGRPDRIQLACLVDRGMRDLPIQPDYLGLRLDTRREDHVSVRLEEVDGEDVVTLERKGD